MIYRTIIPAQPCQLCNGESPRFLQRGWPEPQHQSIRYPFAPPGTSSWPTRSLSANAHNHEAIGPLPPVELADPFRSTYYQTSTLGDRHQDTIPSLYCYSTTTHSCLAPPYSVEGAPDRIDRGRLITQGYKGSSQIRSTAPGRHGRNPSPRTEQIIQGISQEQLGAGVPFSASLYERCSSWERRRPMPDSRGQD